MSFDPTKPVQTRNGRKARIYATDGGGTWPIHGAYEDGYGWTITMWEVDGTYSYTNSPMDLVNIPEKRTVWVNCYEDSQGYAYRTRERADKLAGDERIACVPVTFTEGEGL